MQIGKYNYFLVAIHFVVNNFCVHVDVHDLVNYTVHVHVHVDTIENNTVSLSGKCVLIQNLSLSTKNCTSIISIQFHTVILLPYH